MQNGYCTSPIGSSYTWVNISKTGSQIFRVFGGPPWTSNPSKSRDLTRGFWGRDGKKSLAPLIYPLGGHGTPNCFPLGSTESLLFCQISRPCDKNWGLGGRGKFLVFFKQQPTTRGWQRACTRANYWFYFIFQGTKFAKKIEDRILNFFPVLEIWPPKLYQFFGTFLKKFTSASCEGYKG